MRSGKPLARMNLTPIDIFRPTWKINWAAPGLMAPTSPADHPLTGVAPASPQERAQQDPPTEIPSCSFSKRSATGTQVQRRCSFTQQVASAAAALLGYSTGSPPLLWPFRRAGQPAGGQCLIWRTLVCVDGHSWVAAPQGGASKADDA